MSNRRKGVRAPIPRVQVTAAPNAPLHPATALHMLKLMLGKALGKMRSKYTPQQGKREVERRFRQEARR